MDYFIRIDEPKNLRIALMSAARDSLLMQTTLEELQAIRRSKLILANSVKEDFRQITNMCRRLSETIADEKMKKEVLNSFKAKEEVRENRTILKQEVKDDVKQRLAKKALLKPVAKPVPTKITALKPATKDTLDMLPEIKEETLPVIAQPIRPLPSAETKTEVDRLEYTLSQIEKKLADLQK